MKVQSDKKLGWNASSAGFSHSLISNQNQPVGPGQFLLKILSGASVVCNLHNVMLGLSCDHKRSSDVPAVPAIEI